MTDRQLRQLGRGELLELLLEQARENEQLQAENKALKEQLQDKTLRIDNAGSIAEAALSLNHVFEAAEASCLQYIENIRLMNERQDELAKSREAKSQLRASMILRNAQQHCTEMELETQQKCDEMLDNAEKQVELKWAQISDRLTLLYQSHQGLMELVSQGVSLVPGANGKKNADHQ